MSWVRDVSHFPVRVSAALADLYCAPAERGFARGAASYGLGLTGWQVQVQDGFVVTRVLDGVPAREVVSREAAARQALINRRWCTDAAWWACEERPRILATLKQLASADLGRVGDGELASHLNRVAATAKRGIARHFELHLADMIPLGRLLLAAEDRGISEAEVLARLTGCSPASRFSGDLPGSVTVGRLDVDAPCVSELTAFAARGEPPPRPVPAQGWGDQMLDLLLDDVSATYWIRDDHASLLMSAPVGLVRRALLEVGDRHGLAAELALEATAGEAVGWMRGEGGPVVEDLAGRAARRRSEMTQDASLRVTERSSHERTGSPGPTSVLLNEWLMACDALYERPGVNGIGDHVVRGRAVVALTPDAALDELGPGTVLVVRTTAPAFDAALVLTDAIVCEVGGPLSHAAVSARELGIPAVLGFAGATSNIPHGALVEVDPVRGTVRVLTSRHSSWI